MAKQGDGWLSQGDGWLSRKMGGKVYGDGCLSWRLLSTAALWVRIQTFLKTTNGHKQRSGQHTARQKNVQKLFPFSVCRLNTAMFHWPLSSAATKEVQGPDTT